MFLGNGILTVGTDRCLPLVVVLVSCGLLCVSVDVGVHVDVVSAPTHSGASREGVVIHVFAVSPDKEVVSCKFSERVRRVGRRIGMSLCDTLPVV